MNIITYLKKKLKCYFNGHDWTSDSAQGILLTQRQINLVKAGHYTIVFNEQSKMYCKRCGEISKLQLDDYVLDTFPPRNG